MKRRKMLSLSTLLTLGMVAGGINLIHAADASGANSKKVLYFTKSAGWEHSVVKRENGNPSFSEKILAEEGPKHGVAFTFSKDGSLFTPAYLDGFDAVVFYTSGDLGIAGTDGQPPISPEGKQALLDYIQKGKGFVGVHSASDTYHTNEPGGTNPKDIHSRYQNFGDKADAYIRVLGGEFIKHGAQQNGTLHLIDPKFPGAAGLDGWTLQEEWYSLKDFPADVHAILVLDTKGMVGPEYQRPPFPSTWARQQGQGRVFYTALGHREDVWTNPKFQELLFGGILWAAGAVEADVTPNLEQAAPGHAQLPPLTPEKKK
jgi:uncharacterized protein